MRFVGALILLLLAMPAPALACRCAQLPFADYFQRAEFVATAKLVVATIEDDHRALEFELLASPYKGGNPAQVKGSIVRLATESSTAACGLQPDINAIYVVFAEPDESNAGHLWVNSCNGTRVHLSTRLDEPVGFVDVPARFVAGQLNAYFGLEVLRDVSANAPDASDPENEKFIGLLDLKALAHGGFVEVYAQPARSSSRVEAIHSYDDVASREFAYEQPGAVVVAKLPGWYRVQLNDGFGWIAAEDAGTWFPYPQLPVRRLAYLTSEWSGLVWPEAGAGIPVRKVLATGDERHESSLDVLEVAEIGGMPWFRVEVLVTDPCLGGESKPGLTGWVPAYGRQGKPNAWFYSRGC